MLEEVTRQVKYQDWQESHAKKFEEKHEGSSEKMEVNVGTEITPKYIR